MEDSTKKRAVIMVLLVFSFALSAALTYSACDVKDILYKNILKEHTIEGNEYNITYYSSKNESGNILVKFKVNGEYTDNLEKGDEYTFTDLSEIKILEISPSMLPANDSAQICFNAGLSCITCGTCASNTDCNDNNSCTLDECDGDPLRCRHKLILWCRGDDGCCPKERCTLEQDNDCGKAEKNNLSGNLSDNPFDNLSDILLDILSEKCNLSEGLSAEGLSEEFNASNILDKCGVNISDKCVIGSDCDDNSSSTKDVCEDTLKICIHTAITECSSGDDYCPESCNVKLDRDCDECLNDSSCNDDNACTSDYCNGTPKRCVNNAASGCSLNKSCIPVGARTEHQFCNKDNMMEQLSLKKEHCANDYECLSNRCIKNICRGYSIIEIVAEWFRSLL